MDDQGKPDSTFQGFAYNFGTNLAFALGFVAAFCLLRARDKNIYAPKTYMVASGKRPLPIPEGLLSWIPITLRTSDDTVLKVAGLDGYMFLKFLKAAFMLFFFFAIVNSAILLPINIIDAGVPVMGLDQLTMSGNNLDHKWAHLACMILITVTVISIIYKSVREYAELRQVCLAEHEHSSSIQARALLVASIPKHLNTKEALTELFDVFPGGVQHVTINRKVGALPNLVARRDALHYKLETLMSKWIALNLKAIANKKAPPPRLAHRVGFLGLFGERVDSIRHHLANLQQLNTDIASIRENKATFETQDSAFVLFNNQIGAHVAAQSVVSNHVLHLNPRYLETDPEDVIWNNLDFSSFELMVRQYLGTTVAIGMAILWFLPMGFVSSIAQLDNIQKYFPVIGDIFPRNRLRVHSLNRYYRLPRVSDVQQSVMTKLYFFLLFTVVLASTLGNTFSALLNNVDRIKDRPSTMLNMLAENLPPASNYFINYVIVKSLGTSSGDLFQMVNLFKRRVMIFLFASSPRQNLNVILMEAVQWGTLWPDHTLIFTIGLVYGVISPISNFFIGLYFFAFYVVYRYKLLYVLQTDKNQSYGMFFMKAVSQIYTGVYISLFTFAGIMALNVSSAVAEGKPSRGPSAMFAITLVVLALSVYSHYFLFDRYTTLVNYLPVQKASARDKRLLCSANAHARGLADDGQDKKSKDTVVLGDQDQTSLSVAPEAEVISDDAQLETHFSHPAMVEPQPVVWIPQDENDFFEAEKREVLSSSASLAVTTHGATINEKGKITLTRYSYPENDDDLF
ncbi:phosphate metabolism protein 7 [Massospora cicadina]|nr:phosphate metabolism protein 7 [Massospora cicadina]